MAWENLPLDLLYEIAGRIPCEVDRVRLLAVCHSWRAFFLAEFPRPTPQLPWLLLPSAGAPTFYCSCLLSGIDGISRVHRVPVPYDLRSARYFGSYGRGWLFLADRWSSGNTLLNLYNGTEQRVRIPDILPSSPGGAVLPMIMLAATLSAPPNTDGCVGAAIVHIGEGDDRFITLWPLEMDIALPPILPTSLFQKLHKMYDVIYYDRAFHFLSGWNLVICVPELNRGDLQVHLERRLFHRPGHTYQLTPRPLEPAAQYLVESRGELLLVVRNNPKARSAAFMVFKMTKLDGGGAVGYGWSDLISLDGRMLFVGHGCSRSYEVAQFPGFQEGIYFLDDKWFHPYQIDITQTLKCCRTESDHGRWQSGPPPMVSRCFSHDETTSMRYSSPIWFLAGSEDGLVSH